MELLWFHYVFLGYHIFFFTQQVKESSSRLRVLWAVLDGEEQGSRRWTEQQRGASRLHIRIVPMTVDPKLLQSHPRLPTACRSALYTKSPILQTLILNISASALQTCTCTHNHTTVYTHVPPLPTLTTLSRAAGLWWSPAAAMPHPGFPPFLSPRRVTLRGTWVRSCSPALLWCSKVRLTSSLPGQWSKQEVTVPPNGRQWHTCSALTRNEAWCGQIWLTLAKYETDSLALHGSWLDVTGWGSWDGFNSLENKHLSGYLCPMWCI